MKGKSIFCDLPSDADHMLDQYKSTNHYKRGQSIFYSGNTPNGLYCVNQGTVRMEVDGPLGKGHILRLVGPGGAFGYRALFADEPYYASAVAHDDCEVCVLSKEGVAELIKKFPVVAVRLLQKVSQDLRRSEQRFCGMTDKTATERVAESLLYLKQQFSENSWTRKDIADHAGTTPETVIRTLADFEKDGLIEQKGRSIKITKQAQLAEIAQLID